MSIERYRDVWSCITITALMFHIAGAIPLEDALLMWAALCAFYPVYVAILAWIDRAHRH